MLHKNRWNFLNLQNGQGDSFLSMNFLFEIIIFKRV